MPHLIIEHSANIEDEKLVDMDELVRVVHETALDTGVFPLGGIRTRCEKRDRYRIADGNPDNCFVHLTARIGSGRDVTVRQAAGDKIFAALCDFLEPLYEKRPLGISFEIQEAHPVLNFKKNNIHERLKKD